MLNTRPAQSPFYFAVSPSVFGCLDQPRPRPASRKARAGGASLLRSQFGYDLSSAIELNKQISRLLGRRNRFIASIITSARTVQNLLAFAFPTHVRANVEQESIDHMQINVTEVVDVEGRGAYYDSSGVLAT